ncbi:MAG: hypothetical protein KDA80_15460 [Planctomycetaceae bacterium]|nr:hypothetical protein [Planctomycetaceae bacterium]
MSAVRVANAALVHTTQLVPDKGRAENAQAQSENLLQKLDHLLAQHGSDRADVVKANVYVQDAAVREAFLEALKTWAGDDMPAVSCVATPLPNPQAFVGLDAVFVSRRKEIPQAVLQESNADSDKKSRGARTSILPSGDVVYVSGQAQPGDLAEATRATLDELSRTLDFLQLTKAHVVQLKCFVKPMKDIDIVEKQIAKFFEGEPIPPVSHVEWISGSYPIEIELIAWAPESDGSESVSYSTPPWMKSSPVYSRVARIHGNDRIYLPGFFAKESGSGAEQVRSVFEQMEQALEQSGSDLKHLAKATYYVSDDKVSADLNRLRPDYYDPARPPAASKAMVSAIGIADRTLTIDMIAAPTQ